MIRTISDLSFQGADSGETATSAHGDHNNRSPKFPFVTSETGQKQSKRRINSTLVQLKMETSAATQQASVSKPSLKTVV